MEKSTEYLRRAKQVMESIWKMTASKDNSSLLLNKFQSNYLSTRLQACILDIDGIMQSPAVKARQNRPFWALVLRELWRIVKDAETLIRACCNPLWLRAAILLGDSKESFFSLAFDLEVCKRLINTAANIIQNGGEETSMPIVDTVLEWEPEARCSIRAIIHDLAHEDEKSLREKLELALITNSAQDVVELASNLLRRLNHDTKSTKPAGKRRGYLWKIDPTELKDIGDAMFKSLWKEVRRTTWLGDTFARKVFHGQVQDLREPFEAEATIVAGLFHPNLLTTLGVSVDSKDCSLVMELMEQDLGTFLRDRGSLLPLPVAVDTMLQIAEAMAFMHEQRVVHMDLKSPNVLIRPAKIRELSKEGFVIAKVADFGQSKSKLRSSTQSPHDLNAGTTQWQAPELFKAHVPGSWGQPLKVDVYSFGMMCYELVSGNLPFYEFRRKEIKELVCAGKRPTLPQSIPAALASLIKRCWDGDARNRPSFAAICTELRYMKCTLLTGGDVQTIKFKMDHQMRKKSSIFSWLRFSCTLFNDPTPPRNGRQVPPTSAIKSDLMKGKLVISNMDSKALATPGEAFSRRMEQADEHKASSSQGQLQKEEDTSNPPMESIDESQQIMQEGQASGPSSNTTAKLVDPKRTYLVNNERDLNLELALDALEKAILLEPSDAMYFQRGELKALKGDLRGSLEDMNIAMQLSSTNASTAANTPAVATRYLKRGQIYYRLKEYENALQDFRRSNELLPNCAVVLTFIARTMVLTNDDLNVALQLYDDAIAIAISTKVDREELSRHYYFRGSLKQDMGDTGGSLEDFERSNLLDAENMDCLLEMNQQKLLLGVDFEGVVASLNKLIERQPGNAAAYVSRAIAKSVLKDHAGALSDANAANFICPSDPKMHLVTALVLQNSIQ